MLGNFATCERCGHSIDDHWRENAQCGFKTCSCTGFSLAAPIEELEGAARDKLEQVVDDQSFLAFARALVRERRLADALEKMSPSDPHSSDALGWENLTIWGFLESAVAWAEDSDFGRRQGLSWPQDSDLGRIQERARAQSENPWRMFANFLYAGKVYE